MGSNWLDKHVSFYKCQADNKGVSASYRDILFTRFAIPHKWWAIDRETLDKRSGTANDLQTMIELRKLPSDAQKEKEILKSTLQCFTPSAELLSKKKGNVIEHSRTGIMQLDFDYKDIKDYDVEELKRCVFALPFIAFCGLSCTGKGFYALAKIAEPEKLSEYAEHCFEVLLSYGIKADTSKGKKVENLRYVSYDPNMLFRSNPQPLHIKHFKTRKEPRKRIYTSGYNSPIHTGNALAETMLKQLKEAMPGNRMTTVQKASYTLGGTGDLNLLAEIKDCISRSASFSDELESFLRCADDCFNEGMLKPLSK